MSALVTKQLNASLIRCLMFMQSNISRTLNTNDVHDRVTRRKSLHSKNTAAQIQFAKDQTRRMLEQSSVRR